MGATGWLRVLDLVGGLARRTPDPPRDALGPLAAFENQLLGFAVGAIKKAFDRDSDRMAIEREHLEAERSRAEAALRLEWLRQEADRRSSEVRLVGALALVVWIASAALGAMLADGFGVTAKILLGSAWLALVAALACAALAYRTVAAWVTVAAISPADPPSRAAASVAASLLIGGFALAAASVLIAL